MYLSILLEIRFGCHCEATFKIGFQHRSGDRDASQCAAGDRMKIPGGTWKHEGRSRRLNLSWCHVSCPGSSGDHLVARLCCLVVSYVKHEPLYENNWGAETSKGHPGRHPTSAARRPDTCHA